MLSSRSIVLGQVLHHLLLHLYALEQTRQLSRATLGYTCDWNEENDEDNNKTFEARRRNKSNSDPWTLL